jgi:hypothetical protein
VPALHATAAPRTVADVDAELTHDRLTGDLGLELLCHRRFDEVAPAMRAGIGQRDFVAFADLLGRRRPVSVRAVLGAGLAAGAWAWAALCGREPPGICRRPRLVPGVGPVRQSEHATPRPAVAGPDNRGRWVRPYCHRRKQGVAQLRR